MSSIHDITEELARLLSSQNLGEYLVKVRESKRLMVKLARGGISVVQSWYDYNVSLYLARDGKLTTASFTTSDPREAVKGVVGLLDKVEESPLYAPLPQADGDSIRISDNRITELVESGDASKILEALDLDKGLETAGMAEAEHWVETLYGSNGSNFTDEGTSFNGYIRVFKGEDSGQWSWTSVNLDTRLLKDSLEKAVSHAEECASLPKERVEPGKYRVLLSPMIAANLMLTAADSASAGSIIMGMSYFTGRVLGDRVASEKLTVLDRPRDTSMPDFAGHDDEGIKTYDKPIIRNGRLVLLLHNSKTAKVMRTDTTGNAGWLLPRYYNIEVQPGDIPEREIFEALGDGVYVSNNWYTRFQNHLEGRFSTVARDAVFIVKSGRPAACAKRIRIADTMPSLLQNIEALSREQYQIEWWEVDTPTRIPYIIVSDLGVSPGSQ